MVHSKSTNNWCLFKKWAEYQLKVYLNNIIFNGVLGDVKAFSFSHLICH